MSRKENALPTNTDQYNKEIEEAISRVESGDYFTQEDVEKMSKDW